VNRRYSPPVAAPMIFAVQTDRTPLEQLDEALVRFVLARARYEREHGPRFVDEHRRWTGQPAVELVQLSSR
jgi:hypothetical protein